jgi:hypothetical protein
MKAAYGGQSHTEWELLSRFGFGNLTTANLGQFAQFEEGFAGTSAGCLVTFIGEESVVFEPGCKGFGDLVGGCGHWFE